MTDSSEQARKMLADHAHSLADRTLRQLFDNDPGRFADLSLTQDDMLLDFSRNRLTTETLDLFVDLARACNLEKARDAMFVGMPVNSTERQPALHTSLRHPEGGNTKYAGAIRDARERMLDFAEGVRTGAFTTVEGSPYTDVINIGIGGSALGPAMAIRALAPRHDGPRIHILSNIDSAEAVDVLTGLDPARTLAVVISKTFTTPETLANAHATRAWLTKSLGEDGARRQMVAATAYPDRAAGWGIQESQIFTFSEWVSGRLSVWSAAGLTLAIAIGRTDFESMLAGAAEMDRHFCSAPLPENLPVILGLTGIWNRDFCGHAARAVFPYGRRLALLPDYLQQLEMESNGKSVTAEGIPLTGPSAPLVWGGVGTDAQHAVFQFLHQGSDPMLCEFLIAANGDDTGPEQHHSMLIANCLAQCEALARGRTLQEARDSLLSEGADEETADRLAPHKIMPGNRPSTLIAYQQLDPFTLGRILALYEHRVFVEATIRGTNPFDQMGVELGKELAHALLPVLKVGGEGSTMISGALAHLFCLQK